MRGTGRQRSPSRARPRRTPVEPAAASAPVIEPAVELLEDRSIPIAGARRGLHLGRSLPGAVVGTMLVVGLAFGAALGPGGALGPAADRDGSNGDTAAAGHAGDGGGDGASGDGKDSSPGGGDGTKDDEYAWHEGPDATDKPDTGDGDEPGDKGEDGDGDEPDPTKKPEVDPTEKPDPTPKPTEKPDATKPPTEPMALGLAIKENHPLIEWGSCEGLDFDYYKVVRSTNSTVTWPAGEGDEVIAAVERGGARKAYDKYAPHGDKAWYRVFCVRKGEDGYKVVNASVTKGIDVPEEPAPPTPPDPITLDLDVSPADGGKILLDWSACEVDGFAFYKVVRSTGDDPSYLPWHDGTEVIAVIESAGTTQVEVWAPDGDQTVFYRVQCIGYATDWKVLLGESAAVAVEP